MVQCLHFGLKYGFLGNFPERLFWRILRRPQTNKQRTTKNIKYYIIISNIPLSRHLPRLPRRPAPATTAGQTAGQRRRLYSAVPGRCFVATRSHSAQGEREITFNKGDRVKGQCACSLMSRCSLCICVCAGALYCTLSSMSIQSVRPVGGLCADVYTWY